MWKEWDRREGTWNDSSASDHPGLYEHVYCCSGEYDHKYQFQENTCYKPEYQYCQNDDHYQGDYYFTFHKYGYLKYFSLLFPRCPCKLQGKARVAFERYIGLPVFKIVLIPDTECIGLCLVFPEILGNTYRSVIPAIGF